MTVTVVPPIGGPAPAFRVEAGGGHAPALHPVYQRPEQYMAEGVEELGVHLDQ